ncbi:MAG: diacylglycerol kinase family protein [Rikenellaceae bacterium]
MVTQESLEPWYLLVNPTAGDGRALLDYPRISRLLHDEGICCEPHFTEHKYHAVELTVKAVKDGYRKIIVLGGDGTLHEVVNGLFIQKEVAPKEVLLGVIGVVSSGCDWLKTFGFEGGRYTEMVKALKAEEAIFQDVGVVSYVESQYRQCRYMVGVSGTGFDAFIAKKFTHRIMKGKRSIWGYFWCFVRSFFKYKSTGVKIYIDDQLIYNDLLFSAAVGVCKFNGGGMQPLPDAIVDDGLLDMMLMRPVHFWHLIFRVKYLFDGNISRIGHSELWRGEKIRIESTPEMMVEVDGELFGGTPLEFSLLERAINIVVSHDYITQRDAELSKELLSSNEEEEEDEEDIEYEE